MWMEVIIVWLCANDVLTWSFGSTSQKAPQAKDNGALILLDDLCTKGKTTSVACA